MTTAEYTRDGEKHALAINGHAGYDEHGRDIVCAAVSAIAWELIGFLHRYGGEWEADSGDFYAEAPRGARTDIAFEMTALGLQMIAKKYPRHVEVHIAAQGG